MLGVVYESGDQMQTATTAMNVDRMLCINPQVVDRLLTALRKVDPAVECAIDMNTRDLLITTDQKHAAKIDKVASAILLETELYGLVCVAEDRGMPHQSVLTWAKVRQIDEDRLNAALLSLFTQNSIRRTPDDRWVAIALRSIRTDLRRVLGE
jgi:hypothetical protein